MENSSITYKDNALDGKVYKVECSQCRHKTNHTVKKSLREAWSIDNGALAGVSDFAIVQCNGCDGLHFCKISSSSDDVEPIFDEEGKPIGIEYPDTITLYPQITLKYETRLSYQSIPKDVKTMYDETFTALESGLDHLSTTGIRGTLEQVCLDRGVSKNLKLNKKIDKLYELNVINDEMKGLLHTLRVFSNDGTHEAVDITKSDLQNAWASLNSLMRMIYGTQDQQNYFLNKGHGLSG